MPAARRLPVAVDAMGGDNAPAAIVEGAAVAASRGLPVILHGDEAQLRALLPTGSPVRIQHASALVASGEGPARAVRAQPDASIRTVMRAVKTGDAAAAVTCGDTGAAMAAALFELGRVRPIARPALAAVVPRSDGGRLVVLDLGANVDCTAAQLAQFAVMGHAFARHVAGASVPRVGLLSIGSEPGKGNEQVREADRQIDALRLDYVGLIEPTAAFRGGCDVLVCDGFVGNVLLKTAEATAEVVGSLLKQEIHEDPSGRFGAWLLGDALTRFRSRLDYSSVGGALLLGVDGVVLVGHGRSDPRAVASAIAHAGEFGGRGLAAQLAEVAQHHFAPSRPPGPPGV